MVNLTNQRLTRKINQVNLTKSQSPVRIVCRGKISRVHGVHAEAGHLTDVTPVMSRHTRAVQVNVGHMYRFILVTEYSKCSTNSAFNHGGHLSEVTM